jgi:tetratricopeptide (TPR) repeat protein
MVAGIYVMFFGIRHFSRLLTLQHTAINNIGNVLTENPQERIRPWPFFISQFKVVLHYITMFIWPFNMCVEYDWKISRGIFAADCIGPFIVLALIFGFLLSLYRKNRSHVVVFAALWFFTVLAPRSSFIPSSELLTDYKTFVGSMGILFIFSTVIVYCIERLKEAFLQKELEQFAPLVILPCLLIVMLPVGYAAYSRNLVWSSGVEFWGNILKNAPGKPRAYNNYGVALSESGKYKESIPYYLKAIQMDNHYPDPVNNIAVAYAQTGNVDRGIFYLQKVIEMQPNYPEGYNNLASFLIQKGEYDRAEQSLKVAVKLRPHYGKAYYNLGKVYFAQNRMEEAYESFKNACTIADLDNPAGFETFGRICIALKKYDEAIQALTKMARMAPCRDSYFHLGNAFHIQGDFNKALQAYKQAERYDANDNRLMYNLGETYAKLHDPKMALNYFQRAQSLNYAGANLPIRVAWCLKTLNRLDEAQMLLEQITQQPQMPDDIKRVAQNELKMMREVTV